LQVPCDEGVAIHIGPESCAVAREGLSEALTGERIGQPAVRPKRFVEHAPALRTGGYVIDFWGVGYDVAQRMGLMSEINRIGYHVREMRIVNARGERITGLGTKVFRELTGGRFVTVGRSDLPQRQWLGAAQGMCALRRTLP
jgi:hypothetical protein